MRLRGHQLKVSGGKWVVFVSRGVVTSRATRHAYFSKALAGWAGMTRMNADRSVSSEAPHLTKQIDFAALVHGVVIVRETIRVLRVIPCYRHRCSRSRGGAEGDAAKPSPQSASPAHHSDCATCSSSSSASCSPASIPDCRMASRTCLFGA